ncbi:MAG: hypothetical protein C0473_00625 [Cyanobacteria bacterium DS3.002]|nr:hypothetical protein [Cyanobacteria bacterium DS3.002]MBA4049463.1 hypothetical protein [Cyanobacteria bacterium DS2.008]MBA4078317.1 hypothetical protein [Cyanobacteria bacterium PR.023]
MTELVDDNCICDSEEFDIAKWGCADCSKCLSVAPTILDAPRILRNRSIRAFSKRYGRLELQWEPAWPNDDSVYKMPLLFLKAYDSDLCTLIHVGQLQMAPCEFLIEIEPYLEAFVTEASED